MVLHSVVKLRQSFRIKIPKEKILQKHLGGRSLRLTSQVFCIFFWYFFIVMFCQILLSLCLKKKKFGRWKARSHYYVKKCSGIAAVPWSKMRHMRHTHMLFISKCIDLFSIFIYYISGKSLTVDRIMPPCEQALTCEPALTYDLFIAP